MKHAFSFVLVFFFLITAACGGGSSDSGSGSTEGTVPQNIVGTYSGTFEGRGTNANGAFTCNGTFSMTISQSGGNLVVNLTVDTIVITPCNDAFNFSGSGSYNQTTGNISITVEQGGTTISLSGTATERDGQITMSGQWSTSETSSNNVIASGNWTANRV